MPQIDGEPTSPWHVIAAIAGWLVPGLGHWLIGDKPRGVILLIAILGLWLAGSLIGGLSVFDHKEHRMWFLGQMLIAPSLAMDYTRGQMVERHGEPTPGNDTGFSPAYARTHEQGLLYTSLAGLLNLLVMIDVLYGNPKAKPMRRQLLEPSATGEG